MKKRISMVMAFVLVCNVFTVFSPFSKPMRVQAAAFGVTSSFKTTLKDGISDSVPFEDSTSIPDNEVMIKFPLVDKNGNSSSIGTYRLQYPIEDGRFVHFTVAKENDFATVTYQDFTSAAATTESTYFSPQVYSVVEKRYWNYADYPNLDPIQQPNYQVEISNPFVRPSFTIEKGKGFSFKINGYTIRFLWDRTTDSIYYVTDRVLAGRLMDFELLYQSGIASIPAAATPDSITQVINGISTAAADFSVTPTSEAANGTTRLDKDYLFDMTGAIVETPGKPKGWVEIELSLPKKWNPATSKFDTTVVQGDIANMGLQMSLINTENPSDTRSVLFTDIYNAMNMDNNYSGSVSAVYTAGTGKMKITIKELRSSLLFDDSSFVIGSTTAAEGRFTSKSVKTDPIYTFMSYQIFYVNGKYNLSVTPYENHTGFYMLKVSNDGGMTFYDANTMPSTGKGDVLFPLTITVSGGDTQIYQIAFSKGKPFAPNNIGILSQKSKFKSDPSKLGINLPTQFEVYDVKMSPIKGASSTSDSMALSYKMRWNIASYSALEAMLNATDTKELILTYDLKSILSPIEANTSKVYAKLKVRFYYVGSDIFAEFYEIDSAGDEITSGNVIVKASPVNILTPPYAISGSEPDTATIKGYVEIRTTAYSRDNLNNIKINEFRYPNIYFMSVSHTTTKKGSSAPQPVAPVAESLYDSLTLNAVSGLEVPTAQNVTAANAVLEIDTLTDVVTRSSFDAQYTIPMNKVKEFIDNNLPYEDYDLTYNLYITQDETKLKNLVAIEDYNARIGAAKEAAFDTDSLTTNTIYFSDISGNTAIETITDSRPAIDALRAGEIVRIADIPLDDFTDNTALQNFIKAGLGENYTYTLDGLDKNQKYYIALDVSIKFEDIVPPSTPEWQHSRMSTIAAITTMGDMVVPSPEDKTPPAPVLNKENIGLSYATIFWNKIVDAINPDNPTDFGMLEYEIIRLKDTQMDKLLLDQKLDFDTVFNSKLPDTEKLGFRSDNEHDRLMEYVSNMFVDIDPADTRYTYSPLDVVKFTDNTLQPNTIYFYYVRTVRVINGKELYSSWSAISATTDPVKAPINLKIVRDGVRYDPKTEIVIAFDAPIADLTLLGSDFDLQYSIKKDNEDWQTEVTMDASVLKNSASPVKIGGLDYYHFVYTVSNLKHGTNYSFRVRMADNVYGDYSMFSNIAESRTEVDQEEYEKDKITDDWLDYLKDKMEQAFKNEYWIADDSVSFEAIYRPTMFDGVMLRSIDSQIELVSTDADTAVYLIPQSALLSANAQNKGFRFVHNDIEIIISPNAINTNDNEAVLDAIQRIKDRKAVDYYVQVTLTYIRLSSSTLVDGREPSTPQIDVRLEIVTAEKNSKTWDNEIMTMVLTEMTRASTFNKAADNIKDMIEDNKSSEEIIRYIDRFISGVIPGITDDIHDSFENQKDYTFNLINVDLPIIIKYSGAAPDETVKGYQRENGTWISKTLTSVGNAKAIYTKVTGIFIFGKYKAFYANLTQINGSENLNAIITKYGLDDYLGRGDAFNINAPLTSFAATGVVARIAGASQTANATDFMRGKGYTLPTRSNTAPITLQETVYQVMALYEIRTNSKISSVKIRNFAATSGIAGIKSEYMQSIQVANELGVYTAGKAMLPNTTPTVKDLLQMIANLDKKVKLS